MYICYKSFAELVRFIICEHRIVGHHIAPKTSPSSPKVKSKPDRKVNSLGQPCYLRNKKRSDSCFFCAAVCKKNRVESDTSTNTNTPNESESLDKTLVTCCPHAAYKYFNGIFTLCSPACVSFFVDTCR